MKKTYKTDTLIPTTFKILGHTVNVSFNSQRTDDKNALGCLEPDLNTITLADVSKGKQMPKSSIEHTYLHEVVHLILSHMGEDDLYKNEKFVDLFAGLLHQVLSTSK